MDSKDFKYIENRVHEVITNAYDYYNDVAEEFTDEEIDCITNSIDGLHTEITELFNELKQDFQ